MGGQRELFRVGIIREGVARSGAAHVPCIVTELTSKGVGLHADLSAVPGDRLDLIFALTDRRRIGCTLLVTHAAPRPGGCITAISGEQQQRTRYHEDYAAISLTAF